MQCGEGAAIGRTAVSATALVLVLGWGLRAPAATYFVRASGDDALDGLSPETALASIRTAGRLLRDPGDRVIVGPGVYFEGNIRPRGSGTSYAPIAFFADTSGVLTREPPGPVRIVPPNTPTATTGFIVYGRHDVLIEGFVVEGATDAGIQVRPHSRTGVDSARITLRNNTLRNGRRGIQVTAAGDVTVVGNTLTGNFGVGLLLTGGASAELRPLVSQNTIEQGDVGIALERIAGGAIARNALRANVKSLNIFDTHGLTIVGNEIVGGRRSMISAARNLELTENIIEPALIISAVSGTFVMTKNRFVGEGVGLAISANAARTVVVENRLQSTYISGGAQVDLARNEGRLLQVEVEGTITATDNRFSGQVAVTAVDLEVSRNQAAGLTAGGSDVRIRGNTITGDAHISADRAVVAGNRAAALTVKRPRATYSTNAPSGIVPYVIEGNVCGGTLRVGESGAPVASAAIHDNAIAGMLRIFAGRELQVGRNATGGISCVLSAADSRLVLAENTSRGSTGPGLVVIGARNAVIENNTVAESADSGLAARRTGQLMIAGNEFRSNPAGGVSLQSGVIGDCNADLRVTIDELVTAVGIALGERPLRACTAADLDGYGAVTVDELVLGVAAGLDKSPLRDTAIEIRSNRVEANGRFGINVFALGPVSAIGNRVVHNGGIPIAIYGRGRPERIEIIDNLLGLGGADGLLLETVAGAHVRSNVIFGNRETGILLRDAPGAFVVNNLVYANGDDGIAVGLGTALPTSNALLMNNTLYANGGWGIVIGGPGAPSAGTDIRNNILRLNARGGVAARLESVLGLMIGFNLNADGYVAGVVPDATDFVADPQFVAPAGADGVLGGAGFADDDFHLRPTSAAVDAGSATAAELGITGSAVAEHANDGGVVDLGYHYGAAAQLAVGSQPAR